MLEVIVLSSLAIVWIVFAVLQDLKTREVSDWANFSLIIFALGFRFFYSLFNMDGFGFFYQGLIGFLIFFALGNLFYYGRIFAGGDAKLMMALGAILPFYSTFTENLKFFALFIFLFLVCGAVYGLVISISLAIKNRKVFSKGFKKDFVKNKFLFIFLLLVGLVFVFLGVREQALFFIGLFVVVFPYIYVGAKVADRVCMIRKVDVSKLTVGDWLYKDVSFGNEKIKATWDGLSEKDIKLLKKKKGKVLLRFGIPFTPVFLISFLALVYIFFSGNSFWNNFVFF